MNCPYCNKETEIIETAECDDCIFKVRRCLECGHQFVTTELVGEDSEPQLHISRTLCCKCRRTGDIEHIKRKLYEPLPAELSPCCWITDGVMPDGAEYTEREARAASGNITISYTSYCITKCPLFSPEAKNISKNCENCKNTP